MLSRNTSPIINNSTINKQGLFGFYTVPAPALELRMAPSAVVTHEMTFSAFAISSNGTFDAYGKDVLGEFTMSGQFLSSTMLRIKQTRRGDASVFTYTGIARFQVHILREIFWCICSIFLYLSCLLFFLYLSCICLFLGIFEGNR
jgi:hypothetical protein